MKKIFAIALALVMVLSMASAFAFVGTCGKYEYTCPTASCGVAKAEVVKFVANNTIDQYQESPDCAAVVVGRPIFYGIKITFDKDLNEQWYYHTETKLQIKENNVNAGPGAGRDETADRQLALLAAKKAGSVAGNTYWVEFPNDPVGHTLQDSLNGARLVSEWNQNCVKEAVPFNTNVSVTANVLYDFNGVTHTPSGLTYIDTALLTWINAEDLPSTTEIDYGTFKVSVYKNWTDPDFTGENATVFDYVIKVMKNGANDVWFYVKNGVVSYIWENGTYFKALENGTYISTGTSGNRAANCSDISAAAALIGIKLGDCVNGGTIKAIFGWSNGSANKATWNKDAVAIANAECQVKVEIPKTGDVSVVAYAVMALVAAAGAMGLKK